MVIQFDIAKIHFGNTAIKIMTIISETVISITGRTK